MKPAYLILIFTAALFSLIGTPLVYRIFAFLRAKDEERPFEKENAGRLMWMGIFLIINVFVYHIVELLLSR